MISLILKMPPQLLAKQERGQRWNLKTNFIVRQKRRGGFTLTEMLLVVMIISLIGGAAGGVYVGTHRRMLVDKTARDFLLTAQYARIMAVERRECYTMQLDLANNKFWLATWQWDAQAQGTKQIIVRDPYCKPVELTGDVKFEDVVVAPLGVETRQETDEENGIVFLPDGTAQSAVVQIGDGKTHYAISISAATGKATMYFGTVKEVETTSVDLDAQ